MNQSGIRLSLNETGDCVIVTYINMHIPLKSQEIIIDNQDLLAIAECLNEINEQIPYLTGG